MKRSAVCLVTGVILGVVLGCATREDLRELRAKTEKLNQSCCSFRNSLKQAGDERKDLEKSLSEVSAHLKVIDSRITGITKEYLAVNLQLARVSSAIDDLETGGLSESIGALKKELSEMEDLTRPLMRDVQSLLEKKKDLQALHAALKNEVSGNLDEGTEEATETSHFMRRPVLSFEIKRAYWSKVNQYTGGFALRAPAPVGLILHIRITNNALSPRRIPSGFVLFSKGNLHYQYSESNFPMAFGLVKGKASHWFSKKTAISPEKDELYWFLKMHRLSFEKDPELLLNPNTSKTICVAFDAVRQNSYKLAIEGENGVDTLDVSVH